LNIAQADNVASNEHILKIIDTAKNVPAQKADEFQSKTYIASRAFCVGSDGLNITAI